LSTHAKPSTPELPGFAPTGAERAEHAALLGLAFVLPLSEVPKTVLWIVVIALWLTNRWRTRDFGGPWDSWDTLIACWLGSVYVVCVALGIERGEWGGTSDVLRYTSVLWIMKRARYPEDVLAKLIVAIVLGTLVTLAIGYWRVFIAHTNHYLGLRSVGHVNHSAIYLAIVFGAALIGTRAWWRVISRGWRIAGVAATLVFGVSLFVMQSRAAVGAAFVVTLLLLGVYSWRLRHSLRPVAIGSIVLVVAVLAIRPEVIEKNQELVKEHLFLSYRDAIWRAGFMIWREHPLVGVGMSNYAGTTYEDLERYAAKHHESFDRHRYMLTSHGHSLFVNTLVERGIVGMVPLLAVLAFWAWSLLRHLPEDRAPPLRWTYWGAALTAWVVSVGIGLVNTTLHHEHALLSTLLLGGWLSVLARSHGRGDV
jgi:O-antigen ligase